MVEVGLGESSASLKTRSEADYLDNEIEDEDAAE
jgi:hypothetical protein